VKEAKKVKGMNRTKKKTRKKRSMEKVMAKKERAGEQKKGRNT